MLNFPCFNETNYTDIYTSSACRVLTVFDACPQAFDGYCARLEQEGFEKRQCRQDFAAFYQSGTGVFISFYEGISQLRIVVETDTPYFDYTDAPRPRSTTPQITQVHLEDFGMSYCVRLSDGRFIVIDGGRNFPPDADELFRVMQESATHPIIAAWFFTHPHSDHIPCFTVFEKQYGKEVTIERIFYNFPEFEQFQIEKQDMLEEFYDTVARVGAPVYIPHTGQRYAIGDALCQVLSSPDDSVHLTEKINPASLVIRMELGGQVILWAADASFEVSLLSERYGAYLQSDILQVPHHGFGCGSMEAQIRGFDLIRPHTCLLPVSDYNAYTVFCAYREGTAHLMQNCGVKEMITGDITRTLSLPYTPVPYGAEELHRKFTEGQAAAGSKVWFFTELCTARPRDFVYSVLNTTHAVAHLTIELFFEDKKRALRHIKTEVSPMVFRTFSVTDHEAVESETLYYNPWSLATRGVPENVPFMLRIMSDVPVVVSHPTHTATYRA